MPVSSLFGDSIEDTLNTIRELLGNLPRSRLETAKKVAIQVENLVESIKRDYKNDPAAGLGLAFAVYTVAERLAQISERGEDKPLIQLLS